jgi:hypothetical protein
MGCKSGDKRYIIKKVIVPDVGSRHVIQEDGISFADRVFLNFVGNGVSIFDDGIATVIEIDGGSGSSTFIVPTYADMIGLGSSAPDGSLVVASDATGDPSGQVRVGWGMYVKTSGNYLLRSSQESTIYSTPLADSIESNGVGGISAGTTVSQIRGKNISEVIDLIVFPEQLPVYLAPTVSLTGSNPKLVKVGSTISPFLSASFTQNDAGVVTGYSLARNGTPVSSNQTFTDVNQLLSSPGTISYQGTFNYADGPIKNTSHGNPYPAGQISANNINTGTIQYKWIYPYFYLTSLTDTITGGDMAAGTEVLQNVTDGLTISFNSTSSEYSAFAVLSGSPVFTKWKTNELNQGNIGGADNQTQLLLLAQNLMLVNGTFLVLVKSGV